MADLARLPLTGKEDLQARNAELRCVPEVEVVDRCLTSGTTGRPLVLDQTRADLRAAGLQRGPGLCAPPASPRPTGC